MRLKNLYATAFGILLFVLALVFFNPKSPPEKKPEATGGVQKKIPTDESVSAQDVISNAGKANGTNSKTQIESAATESVDERIFELTELGTSDDTESFQKIIASLSDSDPEIREAALDATIQFGDRNAIPILEKLATTTHDKDEKARIVEAAKFLALPSFSEIRAQRRTNLNSKAISTSRN